MTEEEFRKNQKEQKKLLKKERKSRRNALILFLLGVASVAIFPTTLFAWLNTFLTNIIGSGIANLVAVLAQAAGMAIGGIGGIASLISAKKSKDEINKLQEKVDDYVYELNRDIENLNKDNEKNKEKIEELEKEKKTAMELSSSLSKETEKEDTYQNQDIRDDSLQEDEEKLLNKQKGK